MNGWKITAFVFMALFIISTTTLILENIWIFQLSEEVAEDVFRENECSINTCVDYQAYLYYPESRLCECYADGKVMKQEVIR